VEDRAQDGGNMSKGMVSTCTYPWVAQTTEAFAIGFCNKIGRSIEMSDRAHRTSLPEAKVHKQEQALTTNILVLGLFFEPSQRMSGHFFILLY
jgi:hypothetical protein